VVEVKRGEVWWADLGEPQGSGPGYRHPVIVVSTDTFNESRISTVIVTVITSNLRLANAPGNVRVAARDTGLKRESVVNVSQVLTVDKSALVSRAGHLPARRLAELEVGLRGVLGL
jgi:mRNA interferase MazF